uniref:DDE-1 domain-containing protein n=1 Tax=Crocodylus porosus TaxID=8502 RepID=A0A7M4F3T4_CROPO
EKGENHNVLMKEFNVGLSTVYNIKAQKEQLLKFILSSSETSKALEICCSLHKPKLEQLDSVLYEWFSLKWSEGASISGLCSLKRRLDVSGEVKSADHEAHDLSPDRIYSTNETSLFWRCLPNSTLASGGESSASGFKQNKDQINVLTCANAGGIHKVNLLVVGKFNHPRTFKGIIRLPVVYKAQTNAWMDKDFFMTGFIMVFNMKWYYQRDFLRKFIYHEGTIQNFQSLYNIKDTIFNVACAWNSVKSETLRRTWGKLYGEGCSCYKPITHVFSDAEIIESVVNPEKSAVTEKDSEEDDFGEEEKISWANAASCLDNFIKFAERQSCYSAQEVMQLHIIHSNFMQKRQAGIRDLLKKASRACHKANTESVPSP